MPTTSKDTCILHQSPHLLRVCKECCRQAFSKWASRNSPTSHLRYGCSCCGRSSFSFSLNSSRTSLSVRNGVLAGRWSIYIYTNLSLGSNIRRCPSKRAVANANAPGPIRIGYACVEKLALKPHAPSTTSRLVGVIAAFSCLQSGME